MRLSLVLAAALLAACPAEPEPEAPAPCPPGTRVDGASCTACAAGTFSVTTNSDACAAWTECGPGTFVSAAGTPTSDRLCAACAAGRFSDTTNALWCQAGATCGPGQRVATAATSTSDATCIACGAAEFSDVENAATCSPWTTCGVGERVVATASRVNDRTCAPCSGGTWNAQQNAGWCAPWTACAPGTSVAQPGTAESDRTCAACRTGTWSDSSNATACRAWTTCGGGDTLAVRGSDTSDARCAWVRQFGSNDTDLGGALIAGPDETFFLGGTVYGAITGETSLGDRDCFLARYDRNGNRLWLRQFGSTELDQLSDMVADANGNVYVSGNTRGSLGGQPLVGLQDGFVRKYDRDGAVLWTRQLGVANEYRAAYGLVLDAQGNLTVSEYDALRRFDRNGVELARWTLPTGVTAYGLRTDATGAIYFADRSTTDAVIRKYSATGVELGTTVIGPRNTDSVSTFVVSDALYVGGTTTGAKPGFTNLGQFDAFVMRIEFDGGVSWTRQFGTNSYDYLNALTVDDGVVTLAGHAAGALPGQPHAGNYDAFVRRYDVSGRELSTLQFGTNLGDSAGGVIVHADGTATIAGMTDGVLGSTPNAGGSDVYLMTRLLP